MTPSGIRFRLLKVQHDELVRIVEAMKDSKPANMAELLNVCREVQAEIKAAATAMQDDRAAERSA